MALSANTIRSYDQGDINEHPVYASATIYEGSAVGSVGGYARALTAGDVFLGFACAKVVDTAGVSGTENVSVWFRGKAQLSVTSVAVTDIGRAVFATDDGTFVLTNGGANTKIGTVHRWISSGVAIVEFDASRAPQSAQLQVGKFVSATAGAGVALASTNTAAVRLYADDGGATMTGNVRTAVSRLLVTYAQATVTSLFGFQGQLKVGAVSCAPTHIGGGIWGYLETIASGTVGGTMAGVVGVVDVPSSGTIGASGYASCFLAYSYGLGGTHTGKASVLHVKAPDAGTFDAMFTFTGTTGCIADSGAGGGTSKYLKVLIDGTAYSILVKSDA